MFCSSCLESATCWSSAFVLKSIDVRAQETDHELDRVLDLALDRARRVHRLRKQDRLDDRAQVPLVRAGCAQGPARASSTISSATSVVQEELRQLAADEGGRLDGALRERQGDDAAPSVSRVSVCARRLRLMEREDVVVAELAGLAEDGLVARVVRGPGTA